MNFSIIIPVYNENENILKLIEEITISINDYKDYEIIIIDDGSTDDSNIIIKNILKNYPTMNIVNICNEKNMGQSYSIKKGIEKAKYDCIVTIDGDLQNDPKDIPLLLKIYSNEKTLKLVGGIRKNRKDSNIKKIASIIANKFRMFILNDDCIDTGCSLKVFDKNIFLKFPYFNGIHRFLPALFKGYKLKTKFINVNHRQRIYGKSNYKNLPRLVRGIIDIYRVLKIINKLK